MKFLRRLIPLRRRSTASLHAERAELEGKLKANTKATQEVHRKFAEDRKLILAKIKERSEARRPIIGGDYLRLWSDHQTRYGREFDKTRVNWQKIHDRLCAVLKEIYRRPPAS